MKTYYTHNYKIWIKLKIFNYPGQNTSPGGLPNPGVKPRSPALQADSLPLEPQGKPNNTGVGSLTLLQWIFLTEEPNQGLLHCRQILYQVSYQGIPTHKQIFDPGSLYIHSQLSSQLLEPEWWTTHSTHTHTHTHKVITDMQAYTHGHSHTQTYSHTHSHIYAYTHAHPHIISMDIDTTNARTEPMKIPMHIYKYS